MSQPSDLQDHLTQYGLVCAGFLWTASTLCASPDYLTQETGKGMMLGTLFAGAVWSAVRITGENIRDALANDRPHL